MPYDKDLRDLLKAAKKLAIPVGDRIASEKKKLDRARRAATRELPGPQSEPNDKQPTE